MIMRVSGDSARVRRDAAPTHYSVATALYCEVRAAKRAPDRRTPDGHEGAKAGLLRLTPPFR